MSGALVNEERAEGAGDSNQVVLGAEDAPDVLVGGGGFLAQRRRLAEVEEDALHLLQQRAVGDAAAGLFAGVGAAGAVGGGAQGERVAAAGQHALGTLELETPAAAFPLRLLRVDKPVRRRLALIGDAAHGIHPLSGHGINLGFQDAHVLADLLKDLPAWREPGEAALLERYARARAEETALLQYTTHGLNRLFKPANPVLAAVRNLGLNLTNHLPVVRNALIRYAVSGHF